MMETSYKTRVLCAFSPFLCLSNAFNYANFHHNNWRNNFHSVIIAFCPVLIILILFILVLLIVWNWMDNENYIRTFVVTFPSVISLLHMEMSFIAVMLKSDILIKTIDKLQRVVEKRKSFFISLLLVGDKETTLDQILVIMLKLNFYEQAVLIRANLIKLTLSPRQSMPRQLQLY